MAKDQGELGRLKAEFSIEYNYIKSIRIVEEPDAHARLELCLVSAEMLTLDQVLRLEDEPIKVVDQDGDNIFVGIVQSTGLANEDGYSELNIGAKSLSIKSDRKKNTRTFQSTIKMLSEVANTVTAEYGIKVEVKDDLVIETMLYQDNETDWEFLKRIANETNNRLFTDSKSDLMRIAIGTVAFARKQLGEETKKCKPGIEKDLGKFIKIKENINEGAQAYEYENQLITSYDLTIGVGYMVKADEERTRHAVKSEIITRGESVENRLTLATEDGCRPESKASGGGKNAGTYIKGKIIRVQGSQIKVHFSCDKTQDEGTAMWMPFENTMNNYMYSMPDEGDEVFVYYEKNGKAVALGSRRSDGGGNPDYADPASKTMTSTNKMIKMTPGSCELVAARGAYDSGGGNQAMIQMTDESGILIHSTQDIHIEADQRLILAASKEEVKNSDITENVDKFKSRHTGGEAEFQGGGGSAAPNNGLAILEQLGVNVGTQLWEGAKQAVTVVPHFVSNMQSLFQGGGDGQEQKPPEAPDLSKDPDRPPAESLKLGGVDNCRLAIGESEIRLAGGAITISTPTYKQLGFVRGEHAPIEAPSIMDTILDGAQLLLDIAGCIPGISVVANGINAAISLARGDYVGAACSLLGCVCPGANVAGKAGKAAMAGIKIAEKFGKAGKAAGAIIRLISGMTAVNTILDNKESIMDLGRKIYEGKFNWRDPRDWKQAIQVLGAFTSAAGSAYAAGHGLGGSKKNKGGGADGDGPDHNKSSADDKKNSTFSDDPVNVVTGSFVMIINDFVIKDIGEDFVLSRSYESLHENKRQHLGSRWLLNLGSRLERMDGRIRVLMSDLQLETFEQKNGVWENVRGGDRALALRENKSGYELIFIQEQKTYGYNEHGRLQDITDANGNRIRVEYVGSFISEVILASGKTLRFAYDKDKLASVADSLGRKVEYRYEGEYLTRVTYPNGGTIEYEYTPEGFISGITSPNGHRYVQNEYDSRGRVIRQTMSNGGEVLFFYQEQDRTTTITTPHNGQRISHIYDRRKLVIKTVYGDGTTEEADYDDKENVVRAKDRRGNETFYRYNEASQIIEERFADGRVRSIVYDELGRIIEDKDNAGAHVRYAYDGRGNRIEAAARIEGDLWNRVRWEYDARGKVTAYIDENGARTQYRYKENEGSPREVVTPEGDVFGYEYDEAGRLMAIESPLGRKEYAYNNTDHRTLEIDALGNTKKFEYDKLSNLTKVVFPNQYDEQRRDGKGWQYIYSSFNQITRRIDPLGNVVATPRDAEENIIKEINPNTYDDKTKDGQGIVNEYDADNRKIRIRYPDGGVERILYDAAGNIIKKIQPEDYDESADDGPGYTYAYDERNRLTKITDAAGAVEKAYVYDLSGNIVKLIDAAGYLAGDTDQERPGILYRYNCLDWLLEKRVPLDKQGGDISYQLTRYSYDAAGNISEECRYIDAQDETSAGGRVLRLTFRYDRQSRLVQVEDNTGAAIAYGYNCLNQRIWEKSKIGDQLYRVVKYRYDAAGRMIEVVQRADKEGTGEFTANTKFELDKSGNTVKITTPAGYIIRRRYDDANRLLEETHIDKASGIENRAAFAYDNAGNLIKRVDANGAEEHYKYDLLNRLVKQTGKNGGILRSVYDKNGRLVKRVLPNEYAANGEAARGYVHTFDARGNIVGTIAPDGAVVETNIYDAAGRLLQKYDAADSGIAYEYDLAGRVKKARATGGAEQVYEYDARGNITDVVDGNRNHTRYRLDKWGRVTEIARADGGSEYYAYDCAGNIIEAVDGEGNKFHYNYNQLNKLSEIIDQTGAKDRYNYDLEGRLKRHEDRAGHKLEFSYNLYGSPTEKLEKTSGLRETYEYYPDGSLKAAIAEGMRYGYSYYTDGSLKEKSASGKTLLACDYDLNGNKIRQTDVTGKTTEYSYTDRDFLRQIKDEGQSLVTFRYNDDGSMSEAVGANGMKTTYGYDADKNIAALDIEFNGETIARNRYRYDGSGNRVEKEQLRGTTRYTYDNLNRLIKADYPDYGEELRYDKAGNRTMRIAGGETEIYRYDARNRLTSLEKGGATTAYRYDEAGNLLDDGENNYAYDGFNRLTETKTKDGLVQRNRYDAEGLRHEIEENGRLMRFIYNENKEVVTEQTEAGLKRLIRSYDLWASECTHEKTWYHYASDEQGSIVFVADEQAIKNRYEYDAFGNATVCEEQVDNRYRYTGQQYDPVTQQYYLRARYYNPVIARFTQEDVYRGDGLNLYAYCSNNPVRYYDPSGYSGEEGPMRMPEFAAEANKHLSQSNPNETTHYMTSGVMDKEGNFIPLNGNDRHVNFTSEMPTKMKAEIISDGKNLNQYQWEAHTERQRNRDFTNSNLKSMEYGINGPHDFTSNDMVVSIGQKSSCGTCRTDTSKRVSDFYHGQGGINVPDVYISQNARTFEIMEPITPEISKELNKAYGNKIDYTQKNQTLLTVYNEHGEPISQRRYYMGEKNGQQVRKGAPAKTDQSKIINTGSYDPTRLEICGVAKGGVW